MHDVVDLVTGGGVQHFHLVVLAQILRKLIQQTSERPAHLLHALELVGFGPGAARILNLLLTCGDLGQVAWKLAAGAPYIDLKSEWVLAEAGVDDPLERRIRNEAAVPVVFAFDQPPGSRAEASRSPPRARDQWCASCCRNRQNFQYEH